MTVTYGKNLWNALIARGPESVWVTNVKGHAKGADVTAGRVLQEDKLGNDGADALAVSGALERPLPRGLAQRIDQKKELARATQLVML